MSIEQGRLIEYGDLIKLVLSSIKNRCKNIGNLDNIPSMLKSGASETISGNVTTTYTNNGYHKGTDHRVNQDGAFKSTATISGSNPIAVVSESTIEAELNEFLSARGISLPKETVMTQRGILNFFVNVASFVKTKVVLVGNDLTTDTAVVYVSANKDIPNFPTINTNLDSVNQNDLSKKTIKEMVDSLSRITNYHQLYYNSKSG